MTSAHITEPRALCLRSAFGRFQSDAIGGIRPEGGQTYVTPPLTAFKVSHLFCVYVLPDQDVWVCFLQ